MNNAADQLPEYNPDVVIDQEMHIDDQRLTRETSEHVLNIDQLESEMFEDVEDSA